MNDNDQHEQEVQAIADKLRKMFKGYIRAAFFCAIFTVYGAIVMLIILVCNIFKLHHYYLDLKKYSAAEVFREYGKPLVISMLLTLTLFFALSGLERATFGIGRYSVVGVVLLVTLVVIVKYGAGLKSNILFLLVAIVTSLVLGSAFGMGARLFYRAFGLFSEGPYYRECVIAGAGFALLFALVYSALMPELKKNCEYKYFAGWATVYGAFTGILCSLALTSD